MEKNWAMERKVGMFVIAATLVFIVVIYILGGDKAVFSRHQKMRMYLEEASGLASGGVVQVAGLPAGNITSLDFDTPSGNLVVTLKIDKKYAGKITKGSTASIRTQGALGDKFVMIKPGPTNGEPIGEDGVIPTEEGQDFLSTLGKSGNRIEKAFEILDHINKVVADLENGHFAQNISASSRSLKSAMGSVDEALASQKLKKAMDHFASIMEKIDKGQGSLGGLINDPTVHEDLKSILGGARRSTLLKFLIRSTIKKSEEEEDKAQKK